MFRGCSKLEYLNLKIAEINEQAGYNYIFTSVSPNLLLCSEKEDWGIFFNNNISVNCVDNSYTYNCYMNDSWVKNNKYICENCGKNYFMKENDSKNNDSFINCYEQLEGYFLDKNESIYKLCYISCKTCNIGGNEIEHSCIECNNDFIYEYQKSEYKNCYNEPLYFSTENINKAIETTIVDDIQTTSNNELKSTINMDLTLETTSKPIDISTDYIDITTDNIGITTNNIGITTENAVISTENKGIINDKKYITTENMGITTDFIESKNDHYSTIKTIFYPKLSSEIIQTNNYFQSFELVTNIVTNKIILKENKTEFIQNIIENLLNVVNIDIIENGEDQKIVEENLLFLFTSTENQKNNEDKNNITMNLGECENIIKKEYNISQNDSLYILQVISEEEGMKIPKIEYEVYYPLYGNKNLTKLDLSLCEGSKVEISIAVKINDNLDKFNASSDYYNDICYKTTSESGTDISLKDRKNEFIDNNMTLCEENCDLVGYDYEKEKATCSCDIKISMPENYDIKFDKKDFLKSFIDINNFANISILKCYKIVFQFKNLIKNYGFYILSLILLLYFITLFIFLYKSFRRLKKDITKIITYKKIDAEKKGEIKNEAKEERIIKKPDKRSKEKKRRKSHVKNSKLKSETKNESDIIDLKDKKSKNKKENKQKGRNYSHQETKNYEDKSINTMNRNNSIGFVNTKSKNFQELMEQKDFEMNSFEYEEAVKLDHRNFFEYYISLLKNNHPLFFSFASYKDYNSRIIKMFLFFFSFSLDFTINALFFNDDTMHKIYEDKGKFNFLYQIPQILYSTLISKFIDSLIKNLALSQDNVVSLKQENEKTNLDKKYRKKLLRVLKIKFTFFFIISFIILLLFWYYIACFCGIYVNTQMHLINDSVISLITSLFLPFIINLIPGIFRIPALKVENPTRRFLYKFSSFVENYLL